MSQDQPNQPPTKTEPKTPAPKPKISQSESTLQKVGQTLRQAWSRAQPVLKAQSIKFLRATIRTLEGVLAKLEAPPKTISTAEISTSTQPTATAESSESEVAPVASSAPASGAPDPTPVSSPESMLDKLRPKLEQLQGWWNVALGKIRSWLPESLQKLSDTALTGAVAGILVILLWTTSALLPGKPAKVANVPPSQRDLPTTNLTAPPELSAPEKPQPVEVSPPPPEPVATPSPTPELSPEQQLIAEIQTQVTEIGNQYADRLIQSVQVNLPGSRLIVKASDNWYSLSPSQQDKLAGELLNQAQKRDLGKLEITDFQGTLLARSPVVGGNIVILKRQTPSPAVAAS